MATTTNGSATKALERFGGKADKILQILRDIQLEQHWISPDDVEYLSAELELPKARIEALIGFYSFLTDQPRGRYSLYISNSITDHMLGSRETAEVLSRELLLSPKGVSADGKVTLSNTSCTGLCDQGPAMLVNGRAMHHVDTERAKEMAALIRKGVPVQEWPAEWSTIEDHFHVRGPLLNHTPVPGAAIARAMRLGPRLALAELELVGLRGCGGAGFPTHLKWQSCRAADSDQRYVVCNADEGEPGTFKDRGLLAHYADTLLEGMTVCAVTIGSTRGYIYLRHEYEYQREHLQAAIDNRRKDGLLGREILGHHGCHFDVEIYMGAGSYVCGEESALIESIEGKRGIPRIRPPFPVTRGLWGKPTVVNNVETFSYAAGILEHGESFVAHDGDEPCWKVLSISGDCAKPGIYEVPLGTTISDILDMCGAKDVQAVQVGGPGGTLISAAEFNRRLSFDDLNSAGAFMIFNQDRDMLDVAANFTHFFAHESCGFCTPCRVGTRLMAQMTDKLCRGHGARLDLDQIHRLNKVMTQASHCGLGQVAAVPALTTLEKFPDSFYRRLGDDDYAPAFDVEAAIEKSRAIAREENAAR